MSTDVTVRPVADSDIPAISALHARVFGPGRFVRTAYRVREGLPLRSRFCLVCERPGELIAALRFAPITIGGKGGALMLGPLAVTPERAGQGYGRRLIAEGLAAAKAAGIRLVILVGDEPYYGRFGFKVAPPGRIAMPGPVNPARLLVAELRDGALADASGLVAGDPTA